MDTIELLERITVLSHEFGVSGYVCGGGGNTSAKNDTTLWVKPSGASLASINPTDFIALDRATLGKLYDIDAPSNAAERETRVKTIMQQAMVKPLQGRASVEAPLHNLLTAQFVVHNHPTLINGMTCSKNGNAVCARLFAQALWIDYVDPGYTLCMTVRKAVKQYKHNFQREPSLIFLKNHGVFVSADDPNEIRKLYSGILTTLERHYAGQQVACELTVGPQPSEADVSAAHEKIQQAFGDSHVCVAASGAFDLPEGPISPDHIVYAKSYYLTEEPTAQTVQAFYDKHGYRPHIIAFGPMVLGVGSTPQKAQLALDLAKDAALVKQLAEAFGGIDYMSDAARVFIENWEVESYRSQQIG